MKNVFWFAPLVLALAAVAAPAAARDGDGRHGQGRHDRSSHSRDHDRSRDRDYRRRDRGDDRRWESSRGYGNDHRWRDRDRDGRYRHEHWDRAPRVVYRQPVYRHHAYRPVPVPVYRGAPPWARGRDYRSYGYRNVYYVPYNDYGRYRLYRPSYGHRWVRDDYGNFLLVAAATGIITSVLLNGY